MRGLKNAVFRLQSKITSLKKALTILIDDDEAMALMNLSILRTNPDLYKYVIYLHNILVCIFYFFSFFFIVLHDITSLYTNSQSSLSHTTTLSLYHTLPTAIQYSLSLSTTQHSTLNALSLTHTRTHTHTHTHTIFLSLYRSIL